MNAERLCPSNPRKDRRDQTPTFSSSSPSSYPKIRPSSIGNIVKNGAKSSPLFPLSDIHTITKAMPVSYWCGRFNALSDKARTTDPSESDASRLERVLFEMELWCSSPEAIESLMEFKKGLRATFENEARKLLDKKNKGKTTTTTAAEVGVNIVKPPSGKENIPPLTSKKKNQDGKDKVAMKQDTISEKSVPVRVPLATLPVQQQNAEMLLAPKPNPMPISKSLTNLADSLDTRTVTPENRADRRLSKASSNPGEKTRIFRVFPKIDNRQPAVNSKPAAEVGKQREFDKLKRMGVPPMLRLRETISMFGPNNLTSIGNVNHPGQARPRVSSMSFEDQRFDISRSQTASSSRQSGEHKASTEIRRHSIDPQMKSPSLVDANEFITEAKCSSALDEHHPDSPQEPRQQSPSTPPEKRLSVASTIVTSKPEQSKEIKTPRIGKKRVTTQPRQTRASILRANNSKQQMLDKNPTSPITPKASRGMFGNTSSDSNTSPKVSRLPVSTRKVVVDRISETTSRIVYPLKTQSKISAGGLSESKKHGELNSTGPRFKISRESLEDISFFLNEDDESSPKKRPSGGISRRKTIPSHTKPKLQTSQLKNDEKRKINDENIDPMVTRQSGNLQDLKDPDTRNEKGADVLNTLQNPSCAVLLQKIIPSVKEFERMSESHIYSHNKRRNHMAAMRSGGFFDSTQVLKELNYNLLPDEISINSMQPEVSPKAKHLASISVRTNFNLRDPHSSEESSAQEADISNSSMAIEDSSWLSSEEQSPTAIHLQAMDKIHPAATSTPPSKTLRKFSGSSRSLESFGSPPNYNRSAAGNYAKFVSIKPADSVQSENSPSRKASTPSSPAYRAQGSKVPRRISKPFPVRPSAEALNKARTAKGDEPSSNITSPASVRKLAISGASARSTMSSPLTRGSTGSPRITTRQSSAQGIHHVSVDAHQYRGSSYRPLNLPRLVENQKLLKTVMNQMPEPLPVNPIGVAMDFLASARECDDGPVKEGYYQTGTVFIENISNSVSLEKKLEELKLALTQVEFDLLVQKHRTFKMAMEIQNWKDSGMNGTPPDLKPLQK